MQKKLLMSDVDDDEYATEISDTWSKLRCSWKSKSFWLGSTQVTNRRRGARHFVANVRNVCFKPSLFELATHACLCEPDSSPRGSAQNPDITKHSSCACSITET